MGDVLVFFSVYNVCGPNVCECVCVLRLADLGVCEYVCDLCVWSLSFCE